MRFAYQFKLLWMVPSYEHETMDAVQHVSAGYQVLLAQRIRRLTTDQEILGSNPRQDSFFPWVLSLINSPLFLQNFSFNWSWLLCKLFSKKNMLVANYGEYACISWGGHAAFKNIFQACKIRWFFPAPICDSSERHACICQTINFVCCRRQYVLRWQIQRLMAGN